MNAVKETLLDWRDGLFDLMPDARPVRWVLLALSIYLLVALVLGTVLAGRAPIDVLPDLDRPGVTILTDAHGRVTEDVERLVTQPIERTLLGAPRVERIRSSRQR